MNKKALTFGSWPSPISSKLLTQKSVRLGEPNIHHDYCYWVESRPQENGRCVLMRKALHSAHEADEAGEVLAKTISVRTKAHEYGGASYCLDDSAVYYIDGADQRIYRHAQNTT